MKFLMKIYDGLVSTRSAGLYLILFAIAIGAATFIENDYGTSAAQKVVFKSWWFELLLLLFGITIIANIFKYRIIQQKKWSILTFHASIIVILLGSAITRYSSFEGIMHIRENESSNEFLSSETYLQFEVNNKGNKYRIDEKVLFASLGNNKFKRTYQIEQDLLELKVLDFIPNPQHIMVTDDAGLPTLKIVIGGMQGREEYYLHAGETKKFRGTVFNFGKTELAQAINIKYQNDTLYFNTPVALSQMQMATQKRDSIIPGSYQPLLLRSLYSGGETNFVIGDFNPKAKLELTSSSRKMKGESLGGLHLNITKNGEETSFYVYGNASGPGQIQQVQLGDTEFLFAYGAKQMEIPFSIKLRDFIMDRYPGTNSASSYASEVTLIDNRSNHKEEHRIFMNHILDYDGFRFFQSSFDQDELGTYLSVNHDAWGTRISYLGYILLTLGMLFTLFSPISRFTLLSEKINRLRSSTNVIPLLFILNICALSLTAQQKIDISLPIIDKAHADAWGKVLVQDMNGRIKPINTLSSELLRKISRKESYQGQNSDQVLLGMASFPEIWTKVPFLKIGENDNIKNLLNTKNSFTAYKDFFNLKGEYLLKDEVQKAYNMMPKDRSTYEKELLKLDERVNICGMIFSGGLLKIYPIPEDPNFTWLSPTDIEHQHRTDQLSETLKKFYPAYMVTLQEAANTNDYQLANELLKTIHQYQQQNGGEVLISKQKVQAELILNKTNIFSVLGKWYGLLGLIFLSLLFISVFNIKINLKIPYTICFSMLILGFLFHTTGLGLRWYVSGRAPWSNGYESMIYIAWTTILAGLIFTRKSLGGLSATTILSSVVLMVAGLSFLDPEITPLVPVLKSYWLTIHVSLEAGSYGFLVLGALIGMLNLVLMILLSNNNQDRIFRIIKEMTFVSEKTLIGGLFMLSIGTYLGGVWANESWGRYWGWDAKETWALVTILVYSFILHMRFIPGIQGLYGFNLATLFGFASVLMTYYGVNYYLSGLHSYAAGDPVPIPNFVYYTFGTLILISILAFWKQRKYTSKSNVKE
ncbi:MAG: cytochrome c biogenesis protein CcsA [Saprospiraceae bacterium]|nr:cytochrome c biogenesis protein CcsA [Saprospiraceae bacterium]